MTSPSPNPLSLSVFWSWQSDLPSEATRSLIEEALKDAAKQVQRTTANIIAVDRDTKGEPGTPAIADTILRKIANADIFVWDASIVLRSESRSAPNPNVLLELGFAVAALGWDRVIGVMNTHFGSGEELPFDLRHRRWPIQYALPPRPAPPEDSPWKDKRKEVRGALAKTLAEALHTAIGAPKGGLLRSDLDTAIARRLWQVMPSSWVHNWHERRQNYPQFEERENIDRFQAYRWKSERPELAYKNAELRDAHYGVLAAIQSYLATSAREMVPYTSTDQYVISVKKYGEDRYMDDYDERYDRQVEKVTEAAGTVWEAWGRYIDQLRLQHPDVVLGEDDPA